MSDRERGDAHDPLCWKTGWPQPEHDGNCFGSIQAARADERERIADLVQMKFSMTSARTHDAGCICILCAINSTVDAAVDFIRGGESDG